MLPRRRRQQLLYSCLQQQVVYCTPLLRLNLNGDTLTPRDEIEVLGVTYDRKCHDLQLPHRAAASQASLRKAAGFSKEDVVASRRQGAGGPLQQGAGSLLPGVVRLSCLAWGGGGAARRHLDALLDKVQQQDRAVRLIKDNNAGPVPHLHTLQHRRDVAGLTVVVFKVQEKDVSHLQDLRQPTKRRYPVNTRTVALLLAPSELLQPRGAVPDMASLPTPVHKHLHQMVEHLDSFTDSL